MSKKAKQRWGKDWKNTQILAYNYHFWEIRIRGNKHLPTASEGVFGKIFLESNSVLSI